MKEQWKECLDGYYEVSNLGRVRRARPGSGTQVGKVLSPTLCGGYPSIETSVKGKKRRYSVHRLIAMAFLGPCPPGMEVNHKDGVKTNNHIGNLEYVTSSENHLHAYRTGLAKHKYPETAIREVRSLRKQGMSYAAIARQTGMCSEHCRLIVNNKRRAIPVITNSPEAAAALAERSDDENTNSQ